jgi:hypothetical protein
MTAEPELVPLVHGILYDVVALPKVAKLFQKCKPEARASILETMALYAKEGPSNITEKQFKSEKRFSVGNAGKNVMISAFKGWQVRLYGAVVKLGGKATFLCAEIDDAKKQDKADQDTLKRAAKNLTPYLV